MAIADGKVSLKHLVTMETLTNEEVLGLIRRGGDFKNGRADFQLDRQYFAANLFFENSTRTHKSFEVAEKKLGLDVIEFDAGTSSVIVDLYMGIVRANPMFPNFVVGELNRDPERLFQTVLRDPKKIQPILRLRRQIEEEMDKGLLRKMPVIDLVSTLVSLVVFPLLIRKPLAAAFLDNDMGRFEEYMDRRRDLIVEVITQLMVPDAR